jgi:hypothetical protein
MEPNAELWIMFHCSPRAKDWTDGQQALATAYEAQAALNWARARGILSGEGETRTTSEPENSKIREARDSAFIPHRASRT